MDNPATISDLERRKQVKVRLRQDVSIIEQRYEGRTYFVVKDPVSLRYYRFKEQERFLLDLMDGKHTLEDAQKAFEARFRPERLTLEDLEGFASQLLQAGLAQNESPGAGKQLFDRFKKRKRNQLLQGLLNILYIKIPIFDPDRLLTRMLRPLWFIFTLWFLAFSVVVMAAAIALVAVNWNTFTAKLPTYHQFFTFETLIYLWCALGAVKIIHEFGHGLSCKAFGGEVHEMGALLLVFSPCLYCNVSDSWTLPNKWQRIIIGGAGIYVELIIASLATFAWWYFTDPGTFANSLCLALMIVCSVSTVVFNANPLMRFDGYYILADWLEIPNLRDRANKFLQAIVTEHCLGIEGQPQPYMTRTRQVLFVTYAVVSYVYRWVVTYGILFFMYTFLKPYKLGAISFLLGTGAVATMAGWPLYRLFKALHRRGRIPDMKPARVSVSVAVVLLAVTLVLTIPWPVRVAGLGLVQVLPGHAKKVLVPEAGGFLQELRVEDGQTVRQGDVLAVLTNPELEIKLKLNEREQALRQAQLAALAGEALVAGHEGRLAADYQNAYLELEALRKQHKDLREQTELLTLRAPRDGRVLKRIRREEVGKAQERGVLICEVGDDTALRTVMLVETREHLLVHEHRPAWIQVHGLGGHALRGRVAEIASVEAKDIPPQLSNRAGGDIPTMPDPESKAEKPQQQLYLVAVHFEEGESLAAVHPGTLARVKIESDPQTLWWRLRRALNNLNWKL